MQNWTWPGAIWENLLNCWSDEAPTVSSSRGLARDIDWQLAYVLLVTVLTTWLSAGGTLTPYFHILHSYVVGVIKKCQHKLERAWYCEQLCSHQISHDTHDPEWPDPESPKWHVSTRDLAFFKGRIADAQAFDASSWELLCKKEIVGLVKFWCYRRSLDDGSTEYKSTTVLAGTTAEEQNDFYLDDRYRLQWDDMLQEAEVLEDGDMMQREQVVRWLRSFPLHCICNREYYIARKAFFSFETGEGSSVYGITKAIPYSTGRDSPNVVVEDFYSMWRARTVASPWDDSDLACETTLLHREVLKIPEKLSRIAVLLGMWRFAKSMAHASRAYVEERRSVEALSSEPTTPMHVAEVAIEEKNMSKTDAAMLHAGHCGANIGTTDNGVQAQVQAHSAGVETFLRSPRSSDAGTTRRMPMLCLVARGGVWATAVVLSALFIGSKHRRAEIGQRD